MQSAATYLSSEAQEMVAASRARARGLATWREAAVSWTAAAVAAAGAVAFLAVPSSRAFHPLTFAVLVGCYAVAGRVQYEVGPGVAVPTEIFFVPMLLLLPARTVPLAVALAMLAGQVPALVLRRATATSVAAVVGSCAFAFAPAAVAVAFGDPGPALRHWPLLPLLVAAQFAADFAFASMTERAALGLRPAQIARTMSWVFRVDLMLAPLGLAVAAAGSVTAAALVLPLGAFVALQRFARDREAAISASLELTTAYRGTALLLGDVIEFDDAYTGSHSREVVELATAVAERLELTADERRQTELVALLHDVGKIRMPASIVRKPGPLTGEEWAIMRTHTIEGERMLAKVGGLLAGVGVLVRSCHERWDGAGYPDGLAGEEIPLVSRIVCACDAFHAMTSDRPYRTAMPHADAVAELLRCRGSHFDPRVVDAIVALRS